jgi:enterochelin esterase family protein
MSQYFIIPTPKPGPFLLGPDSRRQPGVPEGTVTKHEWRSEIFPGTVRPYWVYVPAQYTPDKPANVMVFQDGAAYANEARKIYDAEGEVRAPVVFDNLIHQGRLPVTIGIFIEPGRFPKGTDGKDPVSQRGVEYDTLSDQYARFLIEEILPAVGASYRLTDDPNGRAICGASSGGICSFTVAWQRPDAFRKVLSHVGIFADHRGGHVYPTLIRKTPPKPIRVFLQAGSQDLDIPSGNWPLANLEMAAALNFAGYDYHLEYGDGWHSKDHGGAIFPESLL